MILQKTKKNALQKLLSAALNEKDVENAWRGFLVSAYEDAGFTSPCACDGLFTAGEVTMLCEFKWTTELADTKSSLPVIGQVVHYLQKFIEGNVKIPDIIFVGDKNECFVLPTGALLRYAKGNYPFAKYAPSEAGKNLALITDLLKDESLHPVVFDIDAKFDWDVVHAFLMRQVFQLKADLAITVKNLPNVFEYWTKHVMKSSVDENEVIEVFYRVLSSPQGCYLHPKRDGILVAGDKDYKVNKKGYRAFFSLYKETHNPLELRELTANKDRLMTEAKRRRSGAFFTPSDWVDEAHRMLEAELGANWKEEYVVWDCSCGSANLTRDYAFKELYLSTLEDVDIGIIREAGYNPGATVFQFDFLNRSLDELPEKLLNSLREGKKFVFFNNPPYSSTGSEDTAEGSFTRTREEMAEHGLDKSSKQLFAQFLFRINELISTYKVADGCVATFSTATLFCNPQLKALRQHLLKSWSYSQGMLFQASHFSDVASSWGILFSMFKLQGNVKPTIVDLKDYGDIGRIVTTQTKELYNLDAHAPASTWVRSPVKTEATFDGPQFTTGLNWHQDGKGSLAKGALGYFLNHANNVGKNPQGAALYTATIAMSQGLSILPANFDRAVALFAARKLIDSNWINQKDEYMVPNEQHKDYQQFVNDAHVFSLFHSASNQSSLRDITYKEKQWNILNHFFWMDIAQLKQLAVKHNNTAVFNDIIAHPKNRFVHEKLKTLTLSPDAQELLDLASELVVKSFPLREAKNVLEPKFHLNTWDAGWYQVRNGLLKEHFAEDYKAFGSKFKAFASRLRPQVYELGFLRR